MCDVSTKHPLEQIFPFVTWKKEELQILAESLHFLEQRAVNTVFFTLKDEFQETKGISVVSKIKIRPELFFIYYI